MKGENINLLLGKFCASIGKGYNLSVSDNFKCITNIVRICALENSYIKSSVCGEDSTGIYLPGGAIEYFKVNVNDVITIISGSINISSVK